jgi:flagellar L-ring protein precursor FlgH
MMKPTPISTRMLAALFAAAGLVGGCAMTTPSTSVHQPMSVRPSPAVALNQDNGAIFQPGSARLVLFEDRRARYVGDTLTVILEEQTTATKASSSSASRAGSTAIGLPSITRVPGANLEGIDVNASSASSFDGSGNSAANNSFRGQVAVTVIEVYPNGNLLVSGEKQVAINTGAEYIRFSGVVNPVNLTSANTVSSTRVADARIEYKGRGYISEAQTMGFLQRLFLSISPF